MKRLRGRPLQRMRAQVMREQPLCPDCKADGRYVLWEELDHIVPLHKGGGNERKNLVGLCREHHESKTARDMGYAPKEFERGPDGWVTRVR